MKNQHPVDRLAEVRAAIFCLEQEEAELRQYILEHPDDTKGDEFIALIASGRRRKVNIPGLAACVGHQVVERFTGMIVFSTVKIAARVKEDARA